MKKKEKRPTKALVSRPRGRRGAEGKSSGPTSRPQFPVVGIGASAGGLEACTALLKALPVNPGMAFVVVQHLDPHHESILHKLLSKTTEMPVIQVEDGMVLEPDHVYVIPPKHDIAVRKTTLRLLSRRRTAGRHLPVNRFFASLAEDQKGAAIGVILSGTASDGTLGLQAIKSEGGVAFAQDPESAGYPGMPESAILAGCVDFVLPPEEIARELVRLGRLPYARRTGVPEAEPLLPGAADLQKIIQILRTATGVDFSLYKTGTIKRRVARRMILQKIDSLPRYEAYLEQNATEVAALYHDIFIHVTHFFREPETFSALQRKVLPNLIANRPPGEPIRVWVPGCSTGEEAYSIAITLLEFLEKRAPATPIQVFGTDISAPAVDSARAGTYSETAVANVSPERLNRFFVKVGDSYQIGKQVRDWCVFARHDLGKDPPFSRLDLISCRNVLIYMSTALQERVLSLFSYALKPAGFLVLGKSETPGSSARLFVQDDRRWKIYSRNPPTAVARTALAPADHERAPARAATPELTSAAFNLEKAVERIIWQRYAPAALVVDSGMQVVHFDGNAGPYLGPARGAATLHVLKLVREELALDLRTALHRAKKEETPVRRDGIRFPRDGGSKILNLEVIPIKGRHANGADFLILIQEAPAREITVGTGETAEDGKLVDLRQELISTREQLQSIIETQEATNEALTVEHEEVLSANEELQSTNEELETAKEELQSSNEELTTLNEELQNRNAELSQLANDLSNLLVGVSIPVIVVGSDRRIRRFTAAAEPLLNLIPADVGRPISDLRPNIDMPDLDSLISEVSGNGSPVEREVQGRDGRWYSLRMRPYKTAENKIDGVLMALMDIDVMKRGLDQTRRSLGDAVAERDLSASLLDMSGALIVILDAAGRVIDCNRACQEMLGYSLGEVKGRAFWDFLIPPEEADEAKAALASIVEGAHPSRTYERTWVCKDGSRRVIASSSITRRGADGGVRQIISTGIDITRRKLDADALRRSENQLRRLTANLLTAHEEERKRVARELHDDLNQRMAMLANEVSTLEHTAPASAGLLRKQLRSVRERVDQLSDDLRNAAHRLHPSALEHFGLVAAIESHCSDFTKLHGIKVALTHRNVPKSIPLEVALCLYRVTQECLTNVAKHSGAREAAVAIRKGEGHIFLSITDNGTGFDPGLVAAQDGLGIVGIRERVRLVNGTVSINSRPGYGTRIEVRVALTKKMDP